MVCSISINLFKGATARLITAKSTFRADFFYEGNRERKRWLTDEATAQTVLIFFFCNAIHQMENVLQKING